MAFDVLAVGVAVTAGARVAVAEAVGLLPEVEVAGYVGVGAGLMVGVATITLVGTGVGVTDVVDGGVLCVGIAVAVATGGVGVAVGITGGAETDFAVGCICRIDVCALAFVGAGTGV